jgi:hypothetical protein
LGRFIVWGGLGLSIAAILTLLASRFDVWPLVLLTLWPSSIFGAASNKPPTVSISSAVMLALMYGGNFLLYGVIGKFISFAIEASRSGKEEKRS